MNQQVDRGLVVAEALIPIILTFREQALSLSQQLMHSEAERIATRDPDGLAAQLAAVTAERDRLQAECNDLHGRLAQIG